MITDAERVQRLRDAIMDVPIGDRGTALVFALVDVGELALARAVANHVGSKWRAAAEPDPFAEMQRVQTTAIESGLAHPGDAVLGRANTCRFCGKPWNHEEAETTHRECLRRAKAEAQALSPAIESAASSRPPYLDERCTCGHIRELHEDEGIGLQPGHQGACLDTHEDDSTPCGCSEFRGCQHALAGPGEVCGQCGADLRIGGVFSR